MFEQYKLYKYGSSWGISKRFLLFFRRRMAYTKIVRYNNGGSASSRELLLFNNRSTINGAYSELNWLRSTRQEIRSRTMKNGELIEIHRNEPILSTFVYIVRAIRKRMRR